MISSPLVDIASLHILMSFFGAKIAIAYVVVGLILAVIGGTVIDKLGLEDQVQGYVSEIENVDIENIKMTREDRISFSKERVRDIIKRVWLYVLIGVAIGAFIHNWIPQSIVENVVGNNNPFAVLLATAVEIPMYADIFGTLSIAEALFGKGVTELGIDAAVEKVENIKDIMKYGVMKTPALVVDEKVRSFGRVLTPEEIKKYL